MIRITVRRGYPGQTAGASQPLVLHENNGAEEGETVVSSSVNVLTEVSMAVYKPQSYDAANPVYHVKVWDADSNIMAERMVDISKIDPRNCDEVEMSAYAWHLSRSGQYPKAFLNFAGIHSYNKTEQQKYTPENIFDKVNWVDIIRDFMQMQYDAHNMKGYLEYKSFLEFLE